MIELYNGFYDYHQLLDKNIHSAACIHRHSTPPVPCSWMLYLNGKAMWDTFLKFFQTAQLWSSQKVSVKTLVSLRLSILQVFSSLTFLLQFPCPFTSSTIKYYASTMQRDALRRPIAYYCTYSVATFHLSLLLYSFFLTVLLSLKSFLSDSCNYSTRKSKTVQKCVQHYFVMLSMTDWTFYFKKYTAEHKMQR